MAFRCWRDWNSRSWRRIGKAASCSWPLRCRLSAAPEVRWRRLRCSRVRLRFDRSAHGLPPCVRPNFEQDRRRRGSDAMAYKVQPGVIGCAIRPAIAGNDRSLEEILYETTQQALNDAGVTIDDIDGIVVGCNDQLDGRAISVMMASGPVGGVDRDILSTPSGSEHAFILGALRVATGQFRTQLVVAWSPTEASSIPEDERLAADPYSHRRLPLDELAAHAMQAGVLENAVAGIGDLAEAVAEKN